MTSIEKLQIQGIRCYSPEVPQTVEFYKPLTVIVGQNGSGKTTIIESLKHAATGDLPPNSKSGQNFIHDPNIAGTMEVKAFIKLRFRSADGKPMVVTRSFNLTQRQKKKEYKALEGTLQTVDDKQNKVTLSSKCTDLNKLVPTYMGVSHAILENVVFCHQEDSNWCLGDDASLKKRFDEIFAAARYTKAVEEIRKLKNEKAQHVKVLRSEAQTAEERLKRALELRKSKEKMRTEVDDLKQKIERHDAELKELGEQIEELEAQKRRADDLGRERAAIKEQVKAARGALRRQREQVADAYGQALDGNDEALQRRLDAVTASGRERRRQAQEALTVVEDARAGRATAERQFAEATATRDRLKAEAGVLAQVATERDDIARAIAADIGGAVAELSAAGRAGDAPLPERKIAAFARALAEALAAREAAAAAARREADKVSHEHSQAVEEASLKAAGAQSELERAEREIASARLELADAQARCDDATSQFTQAASGTTSCVVGGVSGGSLTAAEVELQRINQEMLEAEVALENARDRQKAAAGARDLADAQRALSAAKSERKALVSELEEAGSRSAAASQADANRAALRRKDEEIRSALDARRDDLAALLGGERDARRALGDGRLLRLARAAHRDAEAASGRAEEDETALQRAYQEKAAGRAARENAMRVKAKEEAQAAEKVRAVDPHLLDAGTDVDRLVEEAAAKVAAAVDDVGTVTFAPRFAKKAMDVLRDKGCCHLCKRHVPDGDMQGVLRAMQDVADRSAQATAQAEARKAVAEADHRRLIVIAPEWRRMDACRREVQTMEAQGRHAKDEEEAANKAAGEAVEKLKQARAAVRTAEALVVVVERLVPVAEEARRLQLLLDQGAQASLDEGPRPQDEVMADLKRKDADVEDLEAKVKRLHASHDQAALEIRQASARLQALDVDKHKAERSMEREKADREAALKLKKRVASLEEDMARLRRNARPLQEALQAARTRRDEAQNRAAAAAADADACARDLRTRADTFESKHGQVGDRARVDQELQAAVAKVEEAAGKMCDAEAAIAAAERAHKEKERLATSQDAELREIRDNQELRTLGQALEVATTRETHIDEELEELSNVTGEGSVLEKGIRRRTDLANKRAEFIGRCNVNLESLRATEKSLRDGDYSHVEDVHRQKAVDLETHTLLVKDLDVYAKALDKSLMKFHSKKMEDINTTIRELWQRTYQGQDIDSIEIQSEHEGETATGKRIHKYRVVMRKGDVYLDMRGRCSAGQKVLASLIIRLALAETFCLNCGILALDEPTTNLDHANVESFARALNEIIQQRRSQANFQLIVITHDEPFVQLIGRAENADYFYRVHKNEEHYSVVERQAIAYF